MTTSPYLNLLRNRIDIARVPFSDRGSRLLVLQEPGQSRLLVKLAERLTELQPDVEAYLRGPPFIRGIYLIDEKGEALDFEVVTYPHIVYFNTRLGEFGLVFQDSHTLAFGLPPQVTAGLRCHVLPQYWEQTERGGVFKSVRNLAYANNGEAVRNWITPAGGGYSVEFVVQAGDDCAITITIGSEAHLLQHEVLPFSASPAAAESRWRDSYRLALHSRGGTDLAYHSRGDGTRRQRHDHRLAFYGGRWGEGGWQFAPERGRQPGHAHHPAHCRGTRRSYRDK
jgi:putative isomerase